MSGSWGLIGTKRESTGTTTFGIVRQLTDLEHEEMQAAQSRLKTFTGSNLLGPLVRPLSRLMDFFGAERPTLDSLNSGAYHSALGQHLSSWLAAFSAFRAQLENVERTTGLANGPVRQEFNRLYRTDPEYRLTWQLRNLDQHHPPATAVVSVHRETRPGGEWTDYRVVIDVDAAVRYGVRTAARPQFADQWRECGHLWNRTRSAMDLVTVTEKAFIASQLCFARLMHNNEAQLVSDMELLSRVEAEIPADFHGPFVARLPEVGEPLTALSLSAVEPERASPTVVALGESRSVLGLPALDAETIRRFGPPDTGAR